MFKGIEGDINHVIFRFILQNFLLLGNSEPGTTKVIFLDKRL